MYVRSTSYESLVGSENESPFAKEPYDMIRANAQAPTLGMIRVL